MKQPSPPLHLSLHLSTPLFSSRFVLNFNDFLMSFAVWVVLLLCEYKDEFPSAVAAVGAVPGSWLVFLLFYILGVSRELALPV